MGRDRNENGTRSRANRAWLRSLGRPRRICRAMGLRGEIGYSLPPTHPYSFEVDHLVPVSMGGELYDRDNIDATHRCRNQWRSNRSVEEVMEIARLRRGGADEGRAPLANERQAGISLVPTCWPAAP